VSSEDNGIASFRYIMVHVHPGRYRAVCNPVGSASSETEATVAHQATCPFIFRAAPFSASHLQQMITFTNGYDTTRIALLASALSPQSLIFS